MKPPSEISIAAFLKRYSAGKAREPRERLLQAVAWYWRDGRCGVLRVNGKIAAIALVRCLDDIAQAEIPYHHIETGHIVWIDDIVSRHPRGIGFLMEMAERRFGRREVFAGTVFKRAGELRMLPWKIVERLSKEETHHVNQHPGHTAAA